MPTVVDLAKRWRRALPAQVAAIFERDLPALEKRTITVRYAGEHVAKLKFRHAAFADLDGWMETVGLGDDVRWQKEKGAAYRNSLPLAIVASRNLRRELVAVRTDDPKLPVLLWTEWSFVPLFPSLTQLLDELSGARKNPIDLLREAMADAETLSAAKRYRAAAERIEAAIASVRAEVVAEAKRTPKRVHLGFDEIGRAATDAGIARFHDGDHAAAEADYELGVAHGASASAHNLMLMAAETERNWDKTLARCQVYDDKLSVGEEAQLEIARCRLLAHTMLGHEAQAAAVVEALRARFFGRDHFGRLIGTFVETLTEADRAGKRSRVVRDQLGTLGDAWRQARAPRAQSPRAWWEALDRVWRVTLRANLERFTEEHVASNDALTLASDAQLAEILALRALRLYTVVSPDPRGRGESYDHPESLTPVAQLAKLETLDLSRTQSHPYALDPVAGLPALTTLILTNTGVDDLGPLRMHAQLARLVINGSKVSDLTPVGTLTKLRTFNCWWTEVTDLSPLDACASLQELNAGRTAARSLPPLAGARQIVHAEFELARFSRKDVAAFKKEHPMANVKYSSRKD